MVGAPREALVACGHAQGTNGVLSLADLSAFEYLTLHASTDPTAAQLVGPSVRSFIDAELDGEGVLLNTLEVYVAADLNATVTAERLLIHVNTAHYGYGGSRRSRAWTSGTSRGCCSS